MVCKTSHDTWYVFKIRITKKFLNPNTRCKNKGLLNFPQHFMSRSHVKRRVTSTSGHEPFTLYSGITINLIRRKTSRLHRNVYSILNTNSNTTPAESIVLRLHLRNPISHSLIITSDSSIWAKHTRTCATAAEPRSNDTSLIKAHVCGTDYAGGGGRGTPLNVHTWH